MSGDVGFWKNVDPAMIVRLDQNPLSRGVPTRLDQNTDRLRSQFPSMPHSTFIRQNSASIFGYRCNYSLVYCPCLSLHHCSLDDSIDNLFSYFVLLLFYISLPNQ